MTTNFSTMLRRTIAVAGALVALAVGGEAAAQTVTLSGTANTTCQWSAFSMQPNGSIAITCAAGGGNNGGGGAVEVATFVLAGPTTVALPSSPTFTVTRQNGPAGQTVGFGYTVTGAGCQWVSQGPFFLAKDESKQLAVSPTALGTCLITLVVQDGHATTPASKQMTVTVSNTTIPPPDPCIANPSLPGCGGTNTDWSQPVPVVSGCPTAATTARLRQLNWGDVLRTSIQPGQEYLFSGMNSGEVMAIRIPGSQLGRMSVSLTQGQGTATPPSVKTELSISRCPGVIETNLPPQCYQSTFTTNFYSITAYNRTDSRGNDQSAYDGCLAATGETFYANIRWTFASCPFGSRACGFSLQWGEGAF
jgi:hypothetical protein